LRGKRAQERQDQRFQPAPPGGSRVRQVVTPLRTEQGVDHNFAENRVLPRRPRIAARERITEWRRSANRVDPRPDWPVGVRLFVVFHSWTAFLDRNTQNFDPHSTEQL